MKKSLLSLSMVLAVSAAALAQGTTNPNNEPTLPQRGPDNQPILASRQAGESQELFNGKNLDGWAGNMNLWSVVDGTIVGRTDEHPIKTNTFLVWTGGTVDNFELHVKYRLTPLNDKGFANSGVQYRSRVNQPTEYGPVISGYQADSEAGKMYTGQLYEERGRGIVVKPGERIRIGPLDAHHKPELVSLGGPTDPDKIKASIHPGQWNDLVIIAEGNRIRHYVNGLLAAEAIDTDETHGAKSGILALQLHAGAPMKVQFKDIQLKMTTP